MVRRHFGAGPAVDDRHLLRAAAQGGPGRVDGGIPPPHDHHFPLELRLPLQFAVAQEVEGGTDPHDGVLVLEPHLLAEGRAEGDEDRVEPLGAAEALEGEVPAEGLSGLHADAEIEDPLDLPVQLLARQAVFGDAVAQHSSELGEGFEDRHPVPPQGQVIGAAQPARAPAHHGHAPAGIGEIGRLEGRGAVVFGDVALDEVDADRLVHLVAQAGDLALADADAAADDRERVPFADEAERLVVVPQGREAQVALDVDPGGTGALAGADAVGVVVRKEELQRRLARGDDPVAPGGDLHPVADPGHAGRQQPGRALDLHHAQEAGAVRLQPGVVAQGGDVVELTGAHHVQDRLARFPRHLPAVDRQFHSKGLLFGIHCHLPTCFLYGRCPVDPAPIFFLWPPRCRP